MGRWNAKLRHSSAITRADGPFSFNSFDSRYRHSHFPPSRFRLRPPPALAVDAIIPLLRTGVERVKQLRPVRFYLLPSRPLHFSQHPLAFSSHFTLLSTLRLVFFGFRRGNDDVQQLSWSTSGAGSTSSKRAERHFLRLVLRHELLVCRAPPSHLDWYRHPQQSSAFPLRPDILLSRPARLPSPPACTRLRHADDQHHSISDSPLLPLVSLDQKRHHLPRTLFLLPRHQHNFSTTSQHLQHR